MAHITDNDEDNHFLLTGGQGHRLGSGGERYAFAGSPTGSPNFGSTLVFGHTQSLAHDWEWSNPYSLATERREVYSAVSDGGQNRMAGGAPRMHRAQASHVETRWRSVFSFPTMRMRFKRD
mmetsp:Transcript_29354/g.58559  ORF Transcript_29354/g.58559 Transcript_29354/m.58559 type:complete len:121 (-) Transcript_29354:53-415(-)|eukprot:CAMPEP_0197547296 /NCGR_PEP_ID=MMETSP1320-20131121/1675_1 /TAXON_ID=91990 /ORGANISM="Bolidomonas sp., Strain RCC2347" /LENGTH=120 /DNA_ID=CAMNT_0043107043 /DNA_START=47 /DNA_END=409 /DNA_ORIENTATION=+